jgi:hypothetical protein
LLLLWLNISDILVTNPSYEGNPFTLYMWGTVGIFLSGWIKIGQVFFFGVLCALVWKVAKPAEWPFAKKLLQRTLMILVAFYTFVVTWNLILYTSLPSS